MSFGSSLPLHLSNVDVVVDVEVLVVVEDVVTQLSQSTGQLT